MFVTDVEVINPCNPSPCGPNSQCREIRGQAICTCIPGYISSPPTCRPECVTSAECTLDKSCSNQKCVDPCRGNCGLQAMCQVINHNPICSCPSGMTGDPFTRCIAEGKSDFLPKLMLVAVFICTKTKTQLCYRCSTTSLCQPLSTIALWT